MSTRLVLETEVGEITVELAAAAAPRSTAYFVAGALEGVYDGTSFFRVVHPDDTSRSIQVIQGGRPWPTDERVSVSLAHETTETTGVRHTEGTISLARFAPGAVYHSFVLCLRNEPSMDFGGARQPDGQGFAAFGRTVSGLDVVRKVYSASDTAEYPAEPVMIIRARLV